VETANITHASEPLGHRNRKPRWRAQLRKEIRCQGLETTNRREIWSVRPSGMSEIPASIKRCEIYGLAPIAGRIWLRATAAKKLCKLNRDRGGFNLITKTEFRHCEVCARPLIGLEAAKRRIQLDNKMPRTTPCGPNCERDAKTGLWKKPRNYAKN
jgi:hypothetical protein